MRDLRFGGALMVLLLAGACAPAHGPAPARAPAQVATTVTVTNDYYSDIVVYAVRSATRFRLGTVARMDIRSFTIPAMALAQTEGIRLMADPLGLSAPYSTELIPVMQGDEIEFHVKKLISNSPYAIRRQ